MLKTADLIDSNLSEIISDDIRAEVVVACLIDAGFSPDSVFFHPQSVFNRNYRKDIIGISDGGTPPQVPNLHFSLSREGLYDGLPKRLFHKLNSDESVEDYKQSKGLTPNEEEEEARKFLLPFEQEFYRASVLLEMQRKPSVFYAAAKQVLLNYWDINVPLSNYQTLCLLHLLPLVHRIRGNYQLLGEVLSILLEVQVSLRVIDDVSEEQYVYTDILPALDEYELDTNFILDDVLINDDDRLMIMIGPLSQQELPSYLYQGEHRLLIDRLCLLLLPAFIEYDVKVILKEGEENFILDSLVQEGILDYTSVLN